MDYILQSKGRDWLNEFKKKLSKSAITKWPHRSFLTSLPLTRKTTDHCLQTRHHWQTSRTWGEAETFPCTVETKMDCIRRGREQVHIDHMALPLGQCSTVQREFLFLQWEKRVLGTASTPSIVSRSVGTSTLHSPHRQL